MPTKGLLLLLAWYSLIFGGCLGHGEEDPSDPGRLSSGYIELDEFPIGVPGVAGLGPFCRRVYECGCPILSPDDIGGCHQEMAIMDEDTCQTMLQRAVPECLP